MQMSSALDSRCLLLQSYLVGDPSWVLLVAIFDLFEVVVWCLSTGN
ncbi:hypothetical protein V6Z12_D07G177800 [Gossypium hirsutum]